ncbi:MAG: DNA mismatch repair endonuclease MutL [Candidatus Alkaliphilus sp. MAG34]|nr:DNA mismatch repair endonuclease MutL [Clostridiales bacterium]
MNRKIEILNDLTINKIAAGEVIEAPHSVVKELVENSIDAGASMVTLEIKEGGKKYIRVTDNGIGIGEEYVERAFMRHSTSKITDIGDLSNIDSLGFRGEALASIAAVSRIKMITRTKNQDYGILLEVMGGVIKTREKTGCPTGTTVIVENLFFNTPARLKFMKSNSAETAEVSKIIARLSLSNPGISFGYINNNNAIFTTPGNSMLSQAIVSVFDKDTFKNLIPLESNESNIKLWGYIGQPNFVRGNRNLQIIYVNGRYVKSRLISKVVEEAYKEKVVINKHPVCVLNLDVDPSEIDVNVHPSKVEIKFEKEEQVQKFVYKSIAKALEENTIMPKLFPRVLQGFNNSGGIEKKGNVAGDILINEACDNYVQKSNVAEKGQFVDKQDRDNENWVQVSDTYEDTVQSSFLDTLLDQYKIIGQIFDTYIILEKGQSFYLIDQHAAHERLIYNKFLEEIKNEKVISQRLVQPKILELSNEDYILLSENMGSFIKMGFHIEEFGMNSVIIRETPMILGKPRDFSFIYEILDETRDDSNVAGYFEDAIIKKACRKAIKANDKLDYCEMKQLVEELHTLTPPLTCPHGRPIILVMRQYDIEKHFKRIQ